MPRATKDCASSDAFRRHTQRLLHIDCVEEPPRPTRADSGCDEDQGGRFELFALCGEARRRKGDGLRQFPQVLGSGGQKELVFGPIWAAEARSTEPEYALQMSEEHLDLLSFAT
jgi:hypothetical protein